MLPPSTKAKKSDGAVKTNQLEADSPIHQPHPKNKGGKEKDRQVQAREIPPHVHPAESAAAAPRIRARDLAPPPLPKRLVGNSGMGGGEFQDGIAIIYQPWRNRKPKHSPHRMIGDLDHPASPLPPVSSTTPPTPNPRASTAIAISEVFPYLARRHLPGSAPPPPPPGSMARRRRRRPR